MIRHDIENLVVTGKVDWRRVEQGDVKDYSNWIA